MSGKKWITVKGVPAPVDNMNRNSKQKIEIVERKVLDEDGTRRKWGPYGKWQNGRKRIVPYIRLK